MKYIFHGTNAKLLDPGLVAGTYFTEDLEIALKYGKDIYVFTITDEQEEKYFHRTEEGYYVTRHFIELWLFTRLTLNTKSLHDLN